MSSVANNTVIAPGKGFVPHLVLPNEERVSLLGKVLEPSPKKALEWKSTEYMFFTSSLMSFFRFSANFVNAVTRRANAIGLQALGLTAIFGVFNGAIVGVRGAGAYRRASKIGDLWGKVIGTVNMLRAPADILGGITFTTFRALSIAAAFTSAKAVATASFVFMQLGSVFYVASYVFMALPAAISYAKNLSFSRKLEGAMTKETEEKEKMTAGLKMLIDEFRGTKEEWKALVQEVIGNPKIYSNGIVKDAPEVDRSKLSEDELEFLYEQATEQGLDDISTEKLFGHLKCAFLKFKKTKQAEFGRKTGADSVAAIKEELKKPANERLMAKLNTKEGIEEAKELLSFIKGEMKKNRILRGGMVFFCAVGLAALIGGMAVSGGTLAIAIAAAWVISTIGFVAIDGYYLYKALQSGNLEGKDKALFFIANTLLLSFSAAAIFLSGGLAPIVIGSVTSCIWLALGTYSFAKWYLKKPEIAAELSAQTVTFN